MFTFPSPRFRSLLIGAGMLAGLMSFAQGTALAQTRTAELDRIQAPAQALPAPEQRVALVMGNSKYESTTPLSNPDNDAQSVAELLNSAGFEVIAATNLTHNDMIQVMQNFSAKIAELGPSTVAMIYYAGHGVQVAGENYLLPVDARIATPSDLVEHGVRLVDLMATLETLPSRLRIVMLDSCRNNPFPNLDDSNRGLAIVDAPLRSIVGYSTSPGAEALDGADGSHSPYTQAFLRLAREPNLPIEQLFKRIRLDVSRATEGLQTPWESSTATTDFVFFGDTAVASARLPERGPVVQLAANMPWRAVDQMYDYVLSEGSPEYYDEFIARFPHDPRSERIRRVLGDLRLATDWHRAVLANSSVAYRSFYDNHKESPYAKVALRLQARPKVVPLMQAERLLKTNNGFQRQLPLSSHARMTMMPVRGTGAGTAGNSKIVNLPSHGGGSDRNFGHNSLGHNNFGQNNLGHNNSVSKPQMQPRQFERRQFSNHHFGNSQARMGRSFGGGGGMRFARGGFGRGGGTHFGGFGRRH